MNQEKPSRSAAEIWEDRYREAELACTNDRAAVDPIDYTQHPFLFKHSIAERVTGEADGDPLLAIARRFLATPARKMLAVGAGLAYSEEVLVRGGYVTRATIFESSTTAAEKARERFSAAGLSSCVEMRTGDVMQAGLTDNEFDLVFVQAAIHHFYKIEEMFALFHRVLEPGGLIIFDEYVGPDHHMYGDDVMEVLDEINECLSPEYRRDALRNVIREEVPRAKLDWMMQMDPSEGVHASMILPLTYTYFDIVERIDYGGTLMRPFFVGILPNFDFADSKDQTIARLIMKIEELLIRSGTLPSYHTRVVGKKLPEPRSHVLQGDLSRITYADWPGFSDFGGLTHIPRTFDFVASDHSDRNWTRGVGNFDKAVVFLPVTRKASKQLLPGRLVHFRNGEVRSIESVVENDGSLIVHFSGNPLDPDVTGYPNRIRVFGVP